MSIKCVIKSKLYIFLNDYACPGFTQYRAKSFMSLAKGFPSKKVSQLSMKPRMDLLHVLSSSILNLAEQEIGGLTVMS